MSILNATELYAAGGAAAYAPINRRTQLVASVAANDGFDTYLVATGEIVTRFDYYVDSVAGNDFNDGKTPLTPLATIAAAVTKVGSTAGLSVGLKRGSTFRNDRLNFGGVGTSVRAYGTGANPRILGSTAISGSWSNVSGNIYSTPLAYTPVNVYWQDASSGAITKLYPGTAGSLTANQWAVSGGNLQVNIGKNPTGEIIEVPANISRLLDTSNGISAGAANQTYRNLTVMFWPGSGGACVGFTGWTVADCTISWNGNDGLDTHSGATGYLFARTRFQGNGTTRGDVLGGMGDGVSAHTLAGGVVEYCSFIDNERTGVGNQADTTNITRYCYFEGQYIDWRVYNTAEGNPPGDHKVYYSIFRRTKTDEVPIVLDGNTDIAITASIHNNTFVNVAASAPRAVACAMGTVDFKNNVIDPGFQQGIGSYNEASGFGYATTHSDYNQFGGTYMYQPGYPPDVTGANDNLADPQVINASGANYGIKGASPAYASGTPLGYTQDFYGNPVSQIAPCRGAVERLGA